MSGDVPQHGRDGWTLVYYEWDADAGVAVLMYERGTEKRTIETDQRLWWTHPDKRDDLWDRDRY